jgi:hypothetical protein
VFILLWWHMHLCTQYYDHDACVYTITMTHADMYLYLFVWYVQIVMINPCQIQHRVSCSQRDPTMVESRTHIWDSYTVNLWRNKINLWSAFQWDVRYSTIVPSCALVCYSSCFHSPSMLIALEMQSCKLSHFTLCNHVNQPCPMQAYNQVQLPK